MSGIFITRRDPEGREAAAAAKRLSFTPQTQSGVLRAGGFSVGVTWIGPRDFVPVHRDEGHRVVLCMLGRLNDIGDDVRLDKRFGRIAAEYRARGCEALTAFSGAGALVAFDVQADACFIATDRCAFFPLYVAYEADGSRVAVCSHPDVLAASYPEEPALDPVNMAAAIFNGSALHPFTCYRDVHFLDAASVYRWTPEGLRRLQRYWRLEPQFDPAAAPEGLGEELAEAITRSAGVRLREAPGRSGLLLSGGLDSRSVLFAAREHRRNLVAVTFADTMNAETRTARKVAARAGVRHEVMFRSPEYYAQILPEAARVSGGLWDLSHCHTTGFTQALNDLGLDLITSGFLFDMLFRGRAVQTLPARWRYLPPKEVLAAPTASRWGKKVPAERSPFVAEILAQRDASLAGVRKDRFGPEDRFLAEANLLSPFSHRSALAEVTAPWRTLPFDLLGADHRLLDLFCRIPPKAKLNRRLMIEALRRLPGGSLRIAYANTGTHLTAPLLVQVVEGFLRERARRRWKRKGITIGSWGSWTDLVRRSRLLRELWFDNRERCERLVSPLMGENPYDVPYDAWAASPVATRKFRRALFLTLWDKHRIRRGSD